MNVPTIERLHPFQLQSNAFPVSVNIQTALLRLDSQARIVGDLAKDWTIPDNTTIEFELKEGAIFHNGDPMDAEAVKASTDRLRDTPESRHSGKLSNVDSVEVMGDTAVRFNLAAPDAVFLAFLTNVPGRAGTIVHVDHLDEVGSDEYNRNPMTSGPFQIESRSIGESITLSAFDDYWDTDENGNRLPYLDSIEYNYVPENSTLGNALQSGSVDFAHFGTGAYQQASNAAESSGHETSASVDAYKYVGFLSTNPSENPELVVNAGRADNEDAVTDKWEGQDIPTTDPKVRRALSLAIDRKRVSEVASQGFEPPAYNPVPSSAGNYYVEKPEAYKASHTYDPEKAKSLLDEAGYTGSPRIEGVLMGENTHNRYMTVVQGMWEEIGVKVSLKPLGHAAAFSEDQGYYSYKYKFFVGNHSGIIDPWMALWQQARTPTGEGESGTWNKALWSNEEFDAALSRSRETLDPEQRQQHVDEAVKIYLEEAPYGLLTYRTILNAYANSVSDVSLPVGISQFHKTKKE